MKFFRITIILKNDTTLSGVRHYRGEEPDDKLDYNAYCYFFRLTAQKIPMKDIGLVVVKRVSKRSKAVKRYLQYIEEKRRR